MGGGHWWVSGAKGRSLSKWQEDQDDGDDDDDDDDDDDEEEDKDDDDDDMMMMMASIRGDCLAPRTLNLK